MINNSNPLISIGMPVYNGALFLQHALDSICSQTFADIELIISDNASTDDTESICRDYARKDQRIRYERLSENQGSVKNFNRLVALARGKYFKWAAADDICLPTFLESTLGVMESDPEVVWTHSQFGKIDLHGAVLSADNPIAEGLAHSTAAGHPRDNHASAERHRRYRGVLLGTSWCADIFGLIRKSVLDRAIPMAVCFGSEKVLIGELALRGVYREVPQTLFYQRVHADAAGHHASRQGQGQVIAPSAKRKSTSPRIALLRGHLKSIQNVTMTRGERARCVGVVGEYVLQISKWKHVMRSEIFRLPLQAAQIPQDRAGVGDQASIRQTKE